MGPVVIRGLPAHVLLVHLVVILVPLAAFVLVACAWSPAVRRRLGIAAPLLSLAALVLVPVTTHAGEWLKDQLPKAPLIQKHADLGDSYLWWVVALFVVSLGVHLMARLDRSALRVGVAALATLVAIGVVVQTVRVGESGSNAVWQGSVG